MNCNICNHSSAYIFSAQVLNKYDVAYHKCNHCGFIQTDQPFWLEEAYTSAITGLDIGLLSRNITLLPIASAIINRYFNVSGKFIDYGGGYGMFTRLMRDYGFDFYRQDIYCENLFAKDFDVMDLRENQKFEMLTAFEVFEHLPDPHKELDKMLQLSNNIFFSTELVPTNAKQKKDWWYFMPETGQHVSLFTKQSLLHLAKKHNLNLYTNDFNLHLFSSKKISLRVFKLLTHPKIAKLYSLFFKLNHSLLQTDYAYVLNKVHKEIE